MLGQQTLGAETIAAAKVGNGTGLITGSVVAAGSKVGKYVAVCIGAAANGGTFEFVDPDGIVLGEIAVGVAFNLGGITATIADGGVDWAEGDQVTYTVAAAAGSGKYDQISFAAVDGLQVAAAILPAQTLAPNGVDVQAGVLVRGPLIVRTEELIWPAGATDPQKAAAIAQLVAKGILVRASF